MILLHVYSFYGPWEFQLPDFTGFVFVAFVALLLFNPRDTEQASVGNHTSDPPK